MCGQKFDRWTEEGEDLKIKINLDTSSSFTANYLSYEPSYFLLPQSS